MRYSIVALLMTLSIAIPAFGVHKVGNVWPLSKLIPPSQLSNDLVKAETAAGNNKFLDAASILDNALKLNDPLSKKYLTRIGDDGPVSLQIELAIADYKYKSPYTRKTEVVDEINRVIKKYDALNNEANWWAFRELYVLLINHYNNVHDYLTMLKYMKIRFELDPVHSIDYPQELYRYNQPEKVIKGTLDHMKAQGCKFTPELILIESKIDRNHGKDTYDRVMEMLLNNPVIWINTFKEGLDEARLQLDVRNPARIKDFYKKLRKLAMIQPPDKAGMERVQWCMQERTKLEGIASEYLGIKTTDPSNQ